MVLILTENRNSMYSKIHGSFTNTTNVCKDIVEVLSNEEKQRLVVFGRYSFPLLKAKNILIGYKQTYDKNL